MRDTWRDRFRALERRVKKLSIAALAHLIRPAPQLPAPDWRARAHRVLYLRYDHIGDMVLVTGILHAIKLAQPGVTIDVLASVRNAGVLNGNPDVDTVYRVQKAHLWSLLGVLAQVRRVHYDAVLDPMVTGASLTSMLIMWASGARHRIGVENRGNNFALTLTVPPVQGAIHYVDHSAALLYAFGIDPSRHAPAAHGASRPLLVHDPHTATVEPSTGWGIWRPRLFLAPSELSDAETFWRFAQVKTCAKRANGRARRLAVNISAGSPLRHWSEERFIAALQWVRQRFPDVQILVLGTAADEPRKRRIGRACGVPVDQTTHARQMMALIATCDFVLTPDTSVTHIASAFGKPVVTMFVGTGGPHWGPYGIAGRIVSTPTPTLASLPLEPVLQALEQILTPESTREAPSSALAGA